MLSQRTIAHVRTSFYVGILCVPCISNAHPAVINTVLRTFNVERDIAIQCSKPDIDSAPSHAVPTASITYTGNAHCPYTLHVNPTWLAHFTEDEIAFWIGHEIMHILLGHLRSPNAPCKEEEYEADIAAACLLHCTPHALSALQKMKMHYNLVDEHQTSHPSFDERIACLEQLALHQKDDSHSSTHILQMYYPKLWHKLRLR